MLRTLLRAWLLLALLVFAPFTAPAQEDSASADDSTSATATGRFGFVDIEIVLDSSQAVRTIVSEVDEDLGRMSRDIEAKKRELRKLRAQLEQQGSVMAETERAKRQQEAVDLLNKIDDEEYRFQRTVRDKQRSTVEPLLEAIIKVIGEVGRRDGYDLIVRGEVVLWGRESVDLTPLIIRELDLRVDELREAVEKRSPGADKAGSSAAPATPLPLIP